MNSRRTRPAPPAEAPLLDGARFHVREFGSDLVQHAGRATASGARERYEGAKIADRQRRAYPDIVPLTVGLAPDVAFARALDTAQQMGWTIVASDKAASRIEASQRSRWFGFTDDIVIRVAPASSGSRIDIRSSSRDGRNDFGVNAERIRAYLMALRAATTS